MYKHKAVVKYLGLDPGSSEQLGYPDVRWYSMHVEKNYTKSYHCALSIKMNLSSTARDILDFVVEDMDKENLITNSASFKDSLNRIKSIKGKSLSSNTINKAFSELTQEGFLLKTDKRGLYKVNPIYFFKGTEEDRIKAVRAVAEEPIKDLAKKARVKFRIKNKKG